MQQAIAESLERGSSFGRISGDDRSKIWHKPWDKPWVFPYLAANDGDSLKMPYTLAPKNHQLFDGDEKDHLHNTCNAFF